MQNVDVLKKFIDTFKRKEQLLELSRSLGINPNNVQLLDLKGMLFNTILDETKEYFIYVLPDFRLEILLDSCGIEKAKNRNENIHLLLNFFRGTDKSTEFSNDFNNKHSNIMQKFRQNTKNLNLIRQEDIQKIYSEFEGIESNLQDEISSIIYDLNPIEQEFYKWLEEYDKYLLRNLYQEFKMSQRNIKDFLKDKMKLKLRDHLNDKIKFNLTIPNEIKEHLNNIDTNFRKLLHFNNKFSNFKEIFETITKNKEFLNNDLNINLNINALDYTNQLIEFLKREYNSLDILKALIKKEGPNLFGTYNIKTREINVYIYPIIIFSFILQCNPSDMMKLTLTHELAHLYTHLGEDTDKNTWKDNHFIDTNKMIIEGLAQYYTYLYSQTELQLQRVFADELKYYSEEYTHFANWIKEGIQNEAVRHAMLLARAKLTNYDDFKYNMENFQRMAGRNNNEQNKNEALF